MAQFTRTEVVDAIRTLFTSNWVATPSSTIAFEPTGFVSSSMTGPWVEVVVQLGATTPVTVGLYQAAQGVIYVTGFVPTDMGKAVARQLIDEASRILLGAVRVAVGSSGAHLQITRATGEIPRDETGFIGLQVGYVLSVV